METYVSLPLVLPNVTDALLLRSPISAIFRETSTNLELPVLMDIQSIDTIESERTTLKISGILHINGTKKTFTGFLNWDNEKGSGGRFYVITP